MAADFETWPHGGSSGQSELRIVLVRNTRDDMNRVINAVLNCENLKAVRVGLCNLYESEQAGRRISFVEAPGWDTLKQKPEIMKSELERSVSLCFPGPHALLLLVRVRSLCEDPSSGEMDSTLELMESLSDRVWRHTIILFDCDEGVEESVVKENICSARKILEKCGGRYFVLQRKNMQIQELFRKIDNLVEENHGDVIPQMYNEESQQKTKESSGETELRQRRGSLDIPPLMNKDKEDSEKKKENVEASKHKLSEDAAKISMDLKQFILMLMGIFGALLGSVTGAAYGVLGSFVGIVVGIIIGVLLAISVYLQSFLFTHLSRATAAKIKAGQMGTG